MKESPVEYFDREYAHRIIGHWQPMGWIAKRIGPFRSLLVGSVLDLGCGLGTLASSAPGAYVGVDYSAIAIKYARENYGHLEAKGFVLSGVQEYVTEIEDETFDTVVLCHILEHLDEDGRSHLFADAKRIAKQRVLIGLPQNSPDPTHFKTVWKRPDVERLVGPTPIRRVNSQWIAVWERNGRVSRLSEAPKAAPKKSEEDDGTSKPPVEAAKTEEARP